jgi:hypothetical protein
MAGAPIPRGLGRWASTTTRIAVAPLRAGVRALRPKKRPVAPLLFTIGYEQHQTPESLVSALRAAGVERLLDVRELPISRRRGFAKTALREALEAAGVRYEHERALGNPKPFRDLYRSGRQKDGERGYRSHIRNGSAWAVDRLAETLTDEPTCLLCFEADHRACHRSLIVSALRERLPALRVEHL